MTAKKLAMSTKIISTCHISIKALVATANYFFPVPEKGP